LDLQQRIVLTTCRCFCRLQRQPCSRPQMLLLLLLIA
jgi:hypothetical protein